MKLPSVTDYQGSAFHYPPFITRYLWWQEVSERHETHANRLCVCVCVCVCKREREWCRKRMNCGGKWLLRYAILSISQLYDLLTGWFEGVLEGACPSGRYQIPSFTGVAWGCDRQMLWISCSIWYCMLARCVIAYLWWFLVPHVIERLCNATGLTVWPCRFQTCQWLNTHRTNSWP